MPDQLKYKYKRPKTSAERLEALVEELSTSPPNPSGVRSIETTKDYIVALLVRARHWERQQEERDENITTEQNWALTFLAALAFVFILNGWGSSRDWDWLNDNRFAVRLWGCVFAAVYVGVSIERTSLFRSLWSFGFTKFVASVAFSALLVFSTGKASSLLNGVFGVDAASFPLTRAFLTGLISFNYLSILLFVVGVFAVFHGFNAIGFVRSIFDDSFSYESAPWSSIVFLILGLIVLGASWRWVNIDFSAEALPVKAYRLAHLLDFNSKHHCANVLQGASLVFVGPEQSRVLVDATPVTTRDMESFINRQVSDSLTVPKEFQLLPCTLSSDSSLWSPN